MNTIRTIMNTTSAYVSFTLSRGIPRYVPRYLNEYRGIPRYNFVRGTHHYLWCVVYFLRGKYEYSLLASTVLYNVELLSK